MDGSFGEVLMRNALHLLLPGRKFKKRRDMVWTEGLEIDAYCATLKLAFEYQGEQHYRPVAHFHRTPGAFETQQARDQRKREAARRVGVTLVEVPYYVGHKNILQFVADSLRALGHEIQEPAIAVADFMSEAKMTGQRAAVMLEKARAIAESHGGRCLSDSYANCHALLQFVCKAGHDFEAELAAVNFKDHSRPRWCRECGGTRRFTFEENKALVTATGYRLLAQNTATVGENKPETQLVVKCPNPEHRPYKVLRGNFLSSSSPGVPVRHCARCAKAPNNRDRGAAQRSATAAEWGLVAPGPFVKRTVDTEWCCLRCNSTTRTSWNTLKARKGYKCFHCRDGAVPVATGSLVTSVAAMLREVEVALGQLAPKVAAALAALELL